MGRNTTEVLEAVVWAMQALERVALAEEVCGALVVMTHDKGGRKIEGVQQDSAGVQAAELVTESKEVSRELSELKKQCFDEWQGGHRQPLE